MNRRFTPREVVLLSILVVLLVAVWYVRLVWLPTSDAIAEANSLTASLQTEIDTQSILATKMSEMETALEGVRGKYATETTLPPYDNLQNVILLLNRTLASTTNYNLDFAPVVKEGDLARRTVTMRFTCQGYTQAKSILTQLYGGPYRCTIGDFSMLSTGDSGAAVNLVTSLVAVAVNVTFYESCIG